MEAKINILLVDDDRGDRQSIIRALGATELTYEMCEVESMEDAFAAIGRDRFNVVLIDYRLPGQDGLRGIVRLHELVPNLPLIMVTGKGDELVATEAMKCGATDYIPKSHIRPDAMRRVVLSALEKVELRRLADLNQELRRSNDELEQFAYVASHDLQEPLRMIATYTALLGERYKGKLDRKADEYIQYAIEGVKRMHQLIQGLLAYSRVGTQEYRLTQVDPNIVIKNVLDSLRATIEESGARITSDELPLVLGDGVQVARVFQNLISNALKFRGSRRPVVHIGAKNGAGQCEFQITDNGIGIDAQYADRIFQMFARLHARERYEGEGIGLALVKRIVDRHGGRIWFNSKMNVGTTFHFTLPSAPGAHP